MRIVSIAGMGGSAVAGATTVLYLAIIRSQGDQSVATVAPWTVTFLICAVVGMTASYLESPRLRSLLFAALAGTMLGVGFLAIFSIGLLLILAGVLFSLAASRAVTSGRARDALTAWAVGIAACILVPAAVLAIG
ncbi:MAG: hypothetical protein ACXVRQ_08475 [Gaiellaceae bacterium]